jgi:hypothetical protein
MAYGMRLMWLTLLLGSMSPMVAAETPPSAEQVLAVFSEAERAELLRGEIVARARTEQETAKTALAVTTALWVPGSVREVAERLRAISLLQAKQEGASKHAIRGPVAGDGQSAAFREVRFTEADEIEALLAAAPGDKLNLSSEEIALFQKLAAGVKGKPAAERADAVNATYRRVLENRYLAYSKGGLAALQPYAREKGAPTSPGQELAATTESMVVLTRHFPAFFKAYRHYPKHQAKSYQHEFVWVRQIEGDRPLYSLEHDMTEVTDQYALIAARLFYVGHSLNTLQVGILCLPYRNGTLVGLANQAFIEQIGRMDSSIARGIGHMKLEGRVKPMFEVLQAQYRGKAAGR